MGRIKLKLAIIIDINIVNIKKDRGMRMVLVFQTRVIGKVGMLAKIGNSGRKRVFFGGEDMLNLRWDHHV